LPSAKEGAVVRSDVTTATGGQGVESCLGGGAMGDYECVANLVTFAVLVWGALAVDMARWRASRVRPPPDRYALPAPANRNG